MPGCAAAVLVAQALEPDRIAAARLLRNRHLDRRGDRPGADAPATGTALDRRRDHPRLGRAVYARLRIAAEFARDQGALPLLAQLAQIHTTGGSVSGSS